MRTLRFISMVDAATLLALGFGLSLSYLGGCSADRAIAPERAWEEVRYHWSEGQGDEAYGDLTIRSSGDMVWDLQGQRASIRGLLAGENLETLTRLIDALPSADYEGAESCDRRYFVSVSYPGGRRSYATGSCDVATPEPLRALALHLDEWVADASEHRLEPVNFRVLARGPDGRLQNETRRVASNRDELLSLIDMAGSAGIGVIPAVDFHREIVVGIFLGSKPTEGYEVDVASVSRTEQRQIVIQEIRTEPDPSCVGRATATSPFVLVSIETSENEDILSEIDTIVRPCGPR